MNKSEKIKESRISSLLKTIDTLEKRFLEHQKAVADEITKLERLRNEEVHIQAGLNDLKARETDFENKRFEAVQKIESQKLVLLEKENSLKKEEIEASQKLRDSVVKLKEAEAKIKTAEVIELKNFQGQKSIDSKLKQIEIERERLVSITDVLNTSRDNLNAFLEKEKGVLKEKEIALSALKEKQREIQDEQDHLNKLISENDEKIQASVLLKAQAKEILERAERKAEESQLSVDRQWNEIEIQKKNLKMIQLRYEKLAKEKGIEKELKELEGK